MTPNACRPSTAPTRRARSGWPCLRGREHDLLALAPSADATTASPSSEVPDDAAAADVLEVAERRRLDVALARREEDRALRVGEVADGKRMLADASPSPIVEEVAIARPSR